MFSQASVCSHGGGGVTPASVGTSPPPSRTDQHSEHLLRDGRYASCVHAGGLSCLSRIFSGFVVILRFLGSSLFIQMWRAAIVTRASDASVYPPR